VISLLVILIIVTTFFIGRELGRSQVNSDLYRRVKDSEDQLARMREIREP
jgi:hypothetical protein